MKPLTYKQLGWLTFWLWLGFVVGMSALVSHDMAAHPRAQAFADFMAQFIPMLDNIRRIPGATEWVRFYYAVFWAVSPIFVVLSWKMQSQYTATTIMPPVSIVKWTAGVVFFGAVYFLMAYWPVADGLGWRDQTMATNVVGIGHHSLMMVFSWVMIGAFLRGTYYFIVRGTPYWPFGKSAQVAANEEGQ
jgi:hypothetical protein